MRIESITIRGFGCLPEKRYEFPEDKAVVIIEENEQGKSTLAAAILAGLCGFAARRAPGEVAKLADVYKPWDSDAYGLEMEIQAGGRGLSITRDFTRGTFVVRDRETNREITAQLDTDLTDHFLQLPRDDFQRVAFVRGKERKSERFGSSPERLQSRLSALVEGSAGDTGAEVAIAALVGATYPDGGRAIKPETAVQRLSQRVEEKTRRMSKLDAELEAVGQSVRELEEGQARLEQLQSRLAELDGEYSAARLAEVRARIAEAESVEAERAALEAELASLEQYARFPAERRDQLTGAAARVREHQQRLNEERANQRALQLEADTVRARVESEVRFASAGSSDLVALGSAEESLAEADRAVRDRQSELAGAKAGGPGAVGKMVFAIGALTALAAVGMLILQTVNAGVSAVLAVAGVLLAAVGLVQGAKDGGRTTEARAKLQEAERSQDEAANRARLRLAAVGVEADAATGIAELLRRTRDALTQYLANREKLDQTEATLRDLVRTTEGITSRVEEENRAIRAILIDAGIDPSLALEDALVRFDAAGRKLDRYREIEKVRLPELARRTIEAEAVEKLRSEETALERETTGSDGASPSRASTEVEADRQSVRRELDETRGRTRQLEQEVGLKVAAYRQEYPCLQEDLQTLQRELERASRFQSALIAAARVLREVAESTRRRWSVALNEQASAILPYLNPDYSDLRFDESLAFTVRRTSDDRILEKADVDARLSTGARDQVYLAVRLACCLELSRNGETAPVILDDPLVASDDSRFESAMRYLVEHLPESNQVIILSCHRLRHERLMGEQWFGERATVLGI